MDEEKEIEPGEENPANANFPLGHESLEERN